MTVIGAVERDKWASDTFAHNHPDSRVLVGDIELIPDEKILDSFTRDEPRVLLGGPPCQGFSICNANAGDPTDPRNSLFREFVRVAKLLAPDVVLMENVPNLTKARTHDKRLVLDIIESELRELGYHVYSKILQATDYGIPQIRRRLFVLGTKKPLDNPFPSATHRVVGENPDGDLFESLLPRCPVLWDAISDLPVLAASEGSEETDYPMQPENDYQALLRNGAKKVRNHKAMNHTKRMVERFASMKWGDSVSDVAQHLRPLRRNGNGVVSDKTYDQNNRRMRPDTPCHTIPASFYANFVHPFQHRNFTAREGARIQSFPDSYVFLGKPTVVSNKLLGREGRDSENYLCQYAQIGNAVPPLLARAIAEHLQNHVFKETVR